MVDWAGGASGALSGAGAGATIGGPWGAAAGGIIGGATGLFGKKKKKKKRLSTLDDRQQELNQFQREAILGEGPLADLYNYDPEAANAVFDQNIARKAYRDLNESAIPSVTGQFRNQGLMQSSYAGDAIAKLARDVQENLDAQRTQYLYGEQSDARGARRNALENFQNRKTFGYDKSQGANASGIDQILASLTPENIDALAGLFK
jgi:hypothetical protein